ncbi:ankyrin [Marasmius fiardii PR-910]|nr:ankyrin [Marasmius fiardii PR-910]
MAEKDPGARLRRAVKENNLFLVKRLVQRTDQRNPDPTHRRYTSLCWAAVLGHEETFEFLLQNGHDHDECSRDSENNTILMILADQKSSLSGPYSTSVSMNGDAMRAALRMARLYYDHYPKTIHWANIHGRTALHVAALKGNEELVRMLCDLGAELNMSDNQGNTPLHYASAWGHLPVVQLLIERGCQYAAKNEEGFTPSDYAYSVLTRDALQEAARIQFENNKKSRRAIYHGTSRGADHNGLPPAPSTSPSKIREIRSPASRNRSGSGTSRTTHTSDSGDESVVLVPTPHSQSSISTSSSPSHNSHFHSSYGLSYSSSSTSNFPGALNPPAHPSSALSQLASRVRERDADAMEKYMRRNRSESSSTDNKSANGSFVSVPSVNGDNISSLGMFPTSGSSTPRRLRSSISASQLRSTAELPESRNRAGTNPTSARPHVAAHHPTLARSPSSSNSLRSKHSFDYESPGSYTGPPSQYAQFPEPPSPSEDNNTPTVGRRMGFNPISKPSLDMLAPVTSSHRRGLSAASFRGS